MKEKIHDAIIIGAGSIGVPAAFYLAKAGLKVLVIDKNTSIGQGSNKTAIGGIRATHSQKAKALLCKKSIEAFSTWKEMHGDDIEWKKGGYVYAIYDQNDAATFQELVKMQQGWGLNIHWYRKDDLLQIIPDLNAHGLLGGTYSPDDGHASPLLSIYAFYRHTKELGVDFHFQEEVREYLWEQNEIRGVVTNNNTYIAKYTINAAGAWSSQINGSKDLDIPIEAESHEAGITEPVAIFMDPFLVDVHPVGNTANFYFYQHASGQVLFCYTPKPTIKGYDTRDTSEFLPMAAKRLTALIPRLKSIRIRRTWRGLYPMTPDGSPYLGKVNGYPGLILAAGMCGQGFMLGPSVAEMLTKIITNNLTSTDCQILDELSLDRKTTKGELLK